MKFALVEGERREARPGLSAECPVCGAAMVARCGRVRYGIGRIGLPVAATIGGKLKPNGIAIGKTTFPKTGRRKCAGHRMVKSTSPTWKLTAG